MSADIRIKRNHCLLDGAYISEGAHVSWLFFHPILNATLLFFHNDGLSVPFMSCPIWRSSCYDSLANL